MKLLVINGPNLNMLGMREKELYGNINYEDLIKKLKNKANSLNIDLDCYQSNHEGNLIDKIQEAYGIYDAIIINAGAYTHTSIAILDALKSVNIPCVEVHITDIKNREDFRKKSYLSYYCEKSIIGRGIKGYEDAIDYFYENMREKK